MDRKQKKRADPQGARRALGRVLKAWRQARKLPLKALARDIGVSLETISAWERGERFPTAENLDNLSQCTGLPVCRFFCRRLSACPPECKSAGIHL